MAGAMTAARTPCLASLAAALLLAGCAQDAEIYPSLSIRDEERVTGTFDPVEPAPYTPPAPGADTLGGLARYHAEATAAHRLALAAAEQARGPITAARGRPVGGEEWAAASIALAEIEAQRSATMLALAEIDRLHVVAQTEARDVSEIVGVLSQVEAMLLEENRLIAALRASLPL